MRKPTKPSRPTVPKPPEELVDIEVELFGGPYEDCEFTLEDLRNMIKKYSDEDPEDVTFRYVEPEIDHGYYGDSAHVTGGQVMVKTRVKNHLYDKQLTAYNKKLAQYKIKLKSYEEKSLKYEEDMEIWRSEQIPRVKARKEKEKKALEKQLAALEKELSKLE